MAIHQTGGRATEPWRQPGAPHGFRNHRQAHPRRPVLARKALPLPVAVLALALGFMALLGGHPAQAQTATALVSNTGQVPVTDSNVGGAQLLAQGFSTGSNGAGYTVEPSGTEW